MLGIYSADGVNAARCTGWDAALTPSASALLRPVGSG
jgi:hypothetical protein